MRHFLWAHLSVAHTPTAPLCAMHILSITEGKVANKAVHLHGLLVQFPMCLMSLSSRFPGSCEIVTCDSLEAFGIGQSVSLDYKLPWGCWCTNSSFRVDISSWWCCRKKAWLAAHNAPSASIGGVWIIINISFLLLYNIDKLNTIKFFSSEPIYGLIIWGFSLKLRELT